PAVSQSAVVGRVVPGNEEVVAFCELRAGATATAQELHAFAAERLAPYKRPAEIAVLASLPATSTGKVLKSRLRELAARPPTGSRVAQRCPPLARSLERKVHALGLAFVLHAFGSELRCDEEHALGRNAALLD